MMGKRAKLSAIALGIAFGVLSGGWMLLVGLSAVYGYFGTDMVNQWASFYPGVAATVKGVSIAAAWGFLQGFVCGLIVGWVYNLCLCCCSRCPCPCCGPSCDKGCGDKK